MLLFLFEFKCSKIILAHKRKIFEYKKEESSVERLSKISDKSMKVHKMF